MLKRGQFFLVAALIIAGVTIGFGTLYNTAKVERQDIQVYKLSEELKSEIAQAYDSGIVQSKTTEQIEADISRLTAYYAQQNPDSNFEVIFGNESSLRSISSLQGDVHPVQIIDLEEDNEGDTGDDDDHETDRRTRAIRQHSGEVELCVTFKEVALGQGAEGTSQDAKESEREVCKPFRVQEGQNFYLVIRKKVKNEEVVVYR